MGLTPDVSQTAVFPDIDTCDGRNSQVDNYAGHARIVVARVGRKESSINYVGSEEEGKLC